jgi:hypothetical protein
MSTFSNFAFKREYEHIAELGDRLGEVEKLVDWESFRPIIGEIYSNKGGKGGRPNYDEVLMIKMLVLQQWHGLSDPELERQVNDRISFRKFLGFPDIIPDRSTIWLFREGLAKTGKDELSWEELQRQLDKKGSGKVSSRMPHSSIQILVTLLRTLHGEMKRRQGETRTVHGQRKAENRILGINYMQLWTGTTISSGEYAQRPHLSMTARSICLKMVKWFIGIAGTRELVAKGTMQP